MNNNKFYNIESKLLSSTVQVESVELELSSENGLEAEWQLILGNYSDIQFPVLFRKKYGKKLQDVLDTGWPSLYLISDHMKTVLEDNNLTGWKTFAIKVMNSTNSEIKGYHGLSITGRCGPLDYNKSEIVEQRLIPNGPLTKIYRGLYIGLDKWDKSDFFLPKNYFGVIVTSKVMGVLKNNNITNVGFKDITEIDTDEHIVMSLQNK